MCASPSTDRRKHGVGGRKEAIRMLRPWRKGSIKGAGFPAGNSENSPCPFPFYACHSRGRVPFIGLSSQARAPSQQVRIKAIRGKIEWPNQRQTLIGGRTQKRSLRSPSRKGRENYASFSGRPPASAKPTPCFVGRAPLETKEWMSSLGSPRPMAAGRRKS